MLKLTGYQMVWALLLKIVHLLVCKAYIFSVLPTGGEFLGFTSSDAVTVVLEDDGTIVNDEAYFLCLPTNTKFMLLHEKERWSPVRRSKQGYVCVLLILTFPQHSLVFWN